MSAHDARTRANAFSEKIRARAKELNRPIRLMEVCGTHTVAIFRHGLRSLLPESIKLISGPGCPVCVTSVGDVEAASEIAFKDNVLLTTFGDMMRVPGKKISLAQARAEGASVEIVYSPLDALKLAKENSNTEIVFFATGFETTSPLVAATLAEAARQNIENFTIHSVHKLVPPALKALMGMGDVQVDGFILPGHVSAIIGSEPYQFLAGEHHRPSVITGFEAEDILSGILMLLDQIVAREARIEIQYAKVVRFEGNPKAVAMIEEFFDPEDAHWRGLGAIPLSGLKLKNQYEQFNALTKFNVIREQAPEPAACECGAVLKGIKIPSECKLFGKACKPEKPIGACMVSSEGSCAAYFKYVGLAE